MSILRRAPTPGPAPAPWALLSFVLRYPGPVEITIRQR